MEKSIEFKNKFNKLRKDLFNTIKSELLRLYDNNTDYVIETELTNKFAIKSSDLSNKTIDNITLEDNDLVIRAFDDFTASYETINANDLDTEMLIMILSELEKLKEPIV